ncbi:hypothetical protein [Mesorhizobium sp.]|nr:hypothetical protein [Mesorhizobium sp.]
MAIPDARTNSYFSVLADIDSHPPGERTPAENNIAHRMNLG